jgi:hypothetical protein
LRAHLGERPVERRERGLAASGRSGLGLAALGETDGAADRLEQSNIRLKQRHRRRNGVLLGEPEERATAGGLLVDAALQSRERLGEVGDERFQVVGAVAHTGREVPDALKRSPGMARENAYNIPLQKGETMGVEPEGETTSFTQALASLKREGSNLLVVGDATDATHAAACDRLLGDTAGNRQRTLVTTDRGACARARTPPHDATEIRYATATRSAAAVAGESSAVERVHDLPALGEAIVEAIRTADRRTGGLAPAQFRLCVDSLEPLVDVHSERSVFRFLHATTNEVRAARGMGHYHLPRPLDTEAVRTVEPLFDAVVEVRDETDGAQQRWRLTDSRADTEWLPL